MVGSPTEETRQSGADIVGQLVRALAFAARKHRHQRRKGADAEPYINHPIEVVTLLATIGGVTDPATLQAAFLHDTLEDTETSAAELEREFGPEVRRIVEEVTDDRSLPKAERKRLQVKRAVALSYRAKLIRIADKISNVRAITASPPLDWPLERRHGYLLWTRDVIAGCRGCCPALEAKYEEELRRGLSALEACK